MVLTLNGLHKQYGKLTAVNRLSLEIPPGAIFGLLGPNGSGKTTTLGMILGVVRPTAGSYQWFGQAPSHQVRKRIGAILEKPNFYPSFSARKNLQLVCKIKEVNPVAIPRVLEQVSLSGRQDDAFKTYSLGMKQRLAIASALLADPEVLILDEPTNGLDPQGIAEIRDLIRQIAQGGKTIVLASHLLDEVQKVCSDFAILKQGNLIHTGRVQTDFGDAVVLRVEAADEVALLKLLEQFPGYRSHRVLAQQVEVTCAIGTVPESLTEFLARHDLYLRHLSAATKSLEQQFIEILAQHA